MSKIKVPITYFDKKKSFKRKPKQNGNLKKKVTYDCPLCSKHSNMLRQNGYCKCVVTELEFETVVTKNADGSKQVCKKVKDSCKPDIIKRYSERLELAGHVLSGKTSAAFRTAKNDFYNSPPWHEARFIILRHYGSTCMNCKASDVQVHVDHIKPLHNYWQLRLDLNNLQVLCSSCNQGKSNIHHCDFRPKDKIPNDWSIYDTHTLKINKH